MIATIDAYTISLFLHISSVVVGFGATFAEAVTFTVAMRVDRKHLPYIHHLQLFINQRLATPALVLIIITGIFQTANHHWGFGHFWISATIVIAIVLGGINGAYFMPTDRRLAEVAARETANGGEPSEQYLADVRKEGLIGTISGLLVIIAIFLMVTKPGA
jgi:uncharacterized membrane protein